MGGKSRRRIGVAAITGLVIAGLAGVSSTSGVGAQDGPVEATGPILIPFGTLTIELADGANQYSLVDGVGEDIEPDEEIVTDQPCATVQPGSGDLLVLSPTPGSATADTVQIRNDALGVNTGGTSCGSSGAAALSGDEQLKIELGPYFDGLDEDVYIVSADLVVTQVKKGNLLYGLDGGDQISPAIVISESPTTVPVEPEISSVDDLFTSITVASDSRKGNEGLSVADGTSFDLVTLDPDFEVAVDCGEKVTEIGEEGDVADSAVYLRGENETKDEGDCEDVGVIVNVLPGEDFDDGSDPDVLGGRVYWDNSFDSVLGNPQAVQGTVTIEWAPVFIEGMTQSQIDDALDRDIDYDGPGTAAGFTDTLWCLSFTDESNFTLPQYAGAGANADGTAPWCLVSDTRVLTNVDVEVSDGAGGTTTVSKPAIVQTEKLAGKGDPWRL